jgi:hypothetical protein
MRRPWTFAFVLLPLLAASSSYACTIPVFRYALDRWPATPYILEADAETIETHESSNRLLRNIIFKESETQRLIAPFATETDAPFWSGTLDAVTFAALSDSPLRREIVRRISTGETAVWILIGSGNEHADDAMFENLDARLTFFQSVARLPVIDPNDPTSELGPGPEVALRFSILRLGRNDPSEEALLRMLLGPEAAKLGDEEPVVAPVFGRGRVLGAWPASMMDEDGIDEACYYLTGACSCQVKEENPGWDLLITADWDATLRAVATTGEGPAESVFKAPKPETIVFGAPPSRPAIAPSPALPLAILPLVLILGAAFSLFTKDSGKTP